MRILVLSDSHGALGNLRRVMLAEAAKADLVIHLGDGESDMARVAASFPEKEVLQVKGNCDFSSSAPAFGEREVPGPGGKPLKIFFTHGHLYQVKSGLYALTSAARDRKAGLVLFGHTHEPYEDYEDGLWIFNPGSLGSGRYGRVEIGEQGILTNLLRLV